MVLGIILKSPNHEVNFRHLRFNVKHAFYCPINSNYIYIYREPKSSIRGICDGVLTASDAEAYRVRETTLVTLR